MNKTISRFKSKVAFSKMEVLKKPLLAGAFTLAFALYAIICITTLEAQELIPGSNEELVLSNANYSDTNNWLRFGGDKSKSVDIFAVYPTVTFSNEEADIPYVRLASPLMRQSAEAWLGRVDRIITQNGNVYAPLYSQLNGLMLSQLSSDEFESYTFATPRNDVFAAFDYFLTHINKGERPFILFGHSQGAALVGEIAMKFLGNEKYYQHNKNHIITYAVGFSVTADGIARNPNLKFSRSANDTGVIVSWNTTAPSEIASGAYKGFGTWNSAALITNPICWETDEDYQSASANKASMVLQPDGSYRMVTAYADAQVDKARGVLVATTVPEADYPPNVPNIGRFHQYDMSFYHDSMRDNIKERIDAFAKKDNK